ncbi:hypothetical protein UU5_00470 [Rhodanobacter sp. 115]|nr:hypothetical protein UU5_00470 [Rhodanobacter sp. 115]
MVLALGMQMTVAEQTIQRLKWRANALCIRPRASQVDQGQMTTGDRGFDRPHQDTGAQRMDRLK